MFWPKVQTRDPSRVYRGATASASPKASSGEIPAAWDMNCLLRVAGVHPLRAAMEDALTSSTYQLLAMHLMNASYGAFVGLAAIYLFLAYRRWHAAGRPSLRRSRSMQSVGCVALFLCLTPLWILSIYRGHAALVHYSGGKEPVTYYTQMSNPSYVAYSLISTFAPLIADYLLIYRLWVISEHSVYIVASPFLGHLAILGMIVKIIMVELNTPSGGIISLGADTRLVPAAYLIYTCANTYCGVIILWKIFSAVISQPCKRDTVINLPAILAIFVESMGSYTILIIVAAALYVAHLDAVLLVPTIVPSAAGVAFMHICVRVEAAHNEHAPSGSISGTTPTSQSNAVDSAMMSFTSAPFEVHGTPAAP